MTENYYEQTPEELLKRIEKAIVWFKTFKGRYSELWYGKLGEAAGMKLLDIVLAFTTLISDKTKEK